MNLLSTILDRLNQRIEVGNIFDQIYGLSELSADGNDKAWVHYIGNGQAVHVTNFDAKQGTLFWSKRGKISVNKIETLKLAGCKSLYETKFSLSANAVVRKSHLPCDSADAQDWIASRVLRLVSGTDPDFKSGIGVVSYEVVPNGYVNEIKSLPANYEWASVTIDIDVNVITGSEDGCYDTCATGDIPLPDFEPCTPCLTEVAVDGVTITGNGTAGDPLVVIGGGSFVASVTATAPLASSGGNNPDISISQASGSTDGYLSSTDWSTFDNKQDALTAGTGIDLTGNVVTNTAPDQVVGLTAGTAIGVSGSYPNFTIDNSAPDQVVSITAGTGISTSGTYPSFTIDNSAPDQIVSLTAGTGINTSGSYPNFTIDNSAPDQIVSLTGGTGIAVSGTYPSFTIDNTQSLSGYVPYTGATNDVNLGTYNLTADHIALNTNPSGAGFVVGATEWNNTIGSSQTLLKGGNVTLKNGVDLVARIVNKVTPNTTLTKAAYQAVRVSGATGGRLSVALAKADTDNNSADTIGLVTETIAPNQEGFIIAAGQLNDINTTGSLQGESWADGDVLYLSPTTAGRLTNIKPTGATGHIVVIGYVEYSHVNQGSIYVKVMNGWELDELHNVYINSPANNEALIYESSTQLWKNKTLAAALGYTPEPAITAGTTSQYWRGDKTWQTLNKAAVGLGNVDNTSDANKPISTATQTALNLKANSSVTIGTTAPLSGGGDLSANRTLSIADAAADGSTKGAAAFTASDFNSASGVISIDYTNGQAASASTKGFLTSTDWTTFNNKQPAGNCITGLTGDVTASGAGSVTATLASNLKTGSCGVTFDGQGGVITINKTAYVQVPYSGTLSGWTLVSDVSGSCTVTVFKDTYANFPPTTTADDVFAVGSVPTLTSQQKNQNLTPTYSGSQATVTAGDWIGFKITGVTSVTWVNLTITITKS